MSDLELGVSTLLWYDDEGLMPHLPLAAEAGFRHIELRRFLPHLDYTSASAMRRMTAAFQENDLAVHSVHMPDGVIADMASPDEAIRGQAVAEAKAVAVALTRLGGRFLVTHAGGAVDDESERAAGLAASRSSLAEVAAFCREVGVKVAVENSLPTRPRLGETVSEVVELVEAVGAGNVGYCLDTSHANLGGGVVAALERVGHKLMTVHLSDNDGTSDRHELPFAGVIDWRAFIERLVGVGYEGVFMFEVRAWDEPAATLREARRCFERMRAWVERERAV